MLSMRKADNSQQAICRDERQPTVNRGSEDIAAVKEKPGLRPASMDGRVKPGHDGGGGESGLQDNALLLSFTFSASRYTLPPISLNLALIWAMPSSMVPLMVMPTVVGSFSVAA